MNPQDQAERIPPQEPTNDVTVLMVCKYLFEENKKMKEKLELPTDCPEANHLDSLLKKALNFKFEMGNDF